MAAQTHPLCFALVPGLAVWLATNTVGHSLLRSRWGLLSVVTAGAVYSPIVVYNAASLFGSASSRLEGVADGIGVHMSGVPYLVGVQSFLASLLDALTNRVVATGGVPIDPVALTTIALTTLAITACVLRRQWFPPLLLASGFVGMPIVMRDFDTTLVGRYTGLMLPALHIAVGSGAALAFRVLQRGAHDASRDSGGSEPLALARPVAASVLVGILVVVGALGLRLRGYFAQELAAQRTNADYFQVLGLVDQNPLPVVVDGGIKRTTGEGSGPSAILEGLFAWRGIAVKKESSPVDLDNYLLAITWPAWVILSDDVRDDLRSRHRLVGIDDGRAATVSDVEGWAAYRYLDRLTARAGAGVADYPFAEVELH
jgi:hypothetical protein